MDAALMSSARSPETGVGATPRIAIPALEARGLSKSFGDRQAVSDLNLRVAPGEIYCLLGPNGAGKTTTISLFLGFLDPSSGSAYVAGKQVASDPRGTKRHLAYVPEQVMLYRNLSGLENLEYFAALAGRDDLGREKLRDILIEVGLQRDAIDQRVFTYSKGMRQKVGIAVAVAKQADALLLDEPTSGLDPKASNEFSALLAEMGRRGVAVLMATHDLFRAKETGDRVGIMRHGRLVAEMDTTEIGHADLERIYLQHMHE
jgi:ABC-2 type transport system ATP-binding protein